MTRPRAILQNLLLVAAGIAVPLLVLEAVLRLAGVDGAPTWEPSFDRERIEYLSQPSRTNPWIGNGEGDYLRVAVIGDSFTIGQGVARWDAYPLRLERLLNLNEGVPPADVRVWAREGTSTYEQLRWLTGTLKWQPDLVVLGVFLNDPELSSDPQIAEWRQRKLPRQPSGRWLTVLRASRALGWLYTRYERLRAARAAQAYYPYLYDREYKGWKVFVNALGQFSRRCRAAGVPFAVVVFPGLGRPGDDYPHLYAHQQIAEVLRSLQVPHLDLWDAFAGRSTERMTLYPGIDHHPSEIGHRLAAHAIFRWLLKEGLVPAAYEPQRQTRRGYEVLRQHRNRLTDPIGTAVRRDAAKAAAERQP